MGEIRSSQSEEEEGEEGDEKTGSEESGARRRRLGAAESEAQSWKRPKRRPRKCPKPRRRRSTRRRLTWPKTPRWETPKRRPSRGARATIANEPRGPDYRLFTAKFDEEIAAEDLCEPEELDRLRGYLDKQLSHLQGVVARLANRLQRLFDGAAEPRLGIRSRRRHARCRAAARIIIDPMHPLSFKREKDTDFRDTW